MTPDERAERERLELLAKYTEQLRSALKWRGKEYNRHRRTGRHLDGWYSEVRKARGAIAHIRALRLAPSLLAALDEARRERDEKTVLAETLAEQCRGLAATLTRTAEERNDARQELCSLLSGHLSPSDAVRADAITRATAARRGWGM